MYFSDKVSRGFVAIYTARMIMRITPAMLGLFLPLFLYEIFEFEFRYVIYYYLAGHFLYAVLLPWGCKYLNRIGLRRSLRIGVFLGAAYYLNFWYLDKLAQANDWSGGFDRIVLFLLISLVIITLRRITYWMPLHTDLAKFTNRSDRGRQVSLLWATMLGMSAVLPVVSGWILENYNFDVLFLIAIFVYFIALIPLMFLPRTKERFCWGYVETWQQLFSRNNRRIVLAHAGNGAEDAVHVIIWPIFIWELLQGDYLEVGIISSLVVVATIILQLSVGRLIDSKDKNKLLRWGNFFYATGWVAKIFIATAFQIFVASTYHNFTKIFSRTPFETLMYEKAADQGHYVDEMTVLREVSLQLGKSLMLVFALLLVPFAGLSWTFFLAALASLAMNFLADRETLEQGRHPA